MTQPITATTKPARLPRHWGWQARLVAAVLRRAVHVFFRDVEVVGREKIPSGVPVVVVANHVNGIIDPLLVGLLEVRAHFLAKSTLWKNPVIRPLLGATGAIPVHRHQDGADTTKNAGSFERCHEALARGETIAIFPEGKSHDGVALAPLRTGAARIVLEAEAKHGDLDVRIVPVGLTFDAKSVFRSRALVRVGDPIDPGPERLAYALDERAAVRRLTDRIARGLEAVTLNHGSWREARLIERAAALHDRSAHELPSSPGLDGGFAVRHTLAAGYRDLAKREPERVAAVAQALERYDRLLTALRLRDDQVTARYPSRAVARAALRSALFLLVWLPLAAVGTVVSWIPYRLIGVAATRFARSADVVATYKLFGGVLVYPLWWSACGAWVWHVAGPAAGIATVPLAAVSAYAAMVFHERTGQVMEEARAYVLLRSRDALASELAARRAEVAADVRALVDAYRSATAEPERLAASGR